MDVGNRDFNFSINNLFCEYTENLNDVNNYLEEINRLVTSSSLEEFYKKYIINLICLDHEKYEIVYENAKACLSIYEELNQSDRDSYRSEYLFSRYYVIFLKEYIEKNDQIENELINLKKQIQAEEKNEILDKLLRKINLYLFILSENASLLQDNILEYNQYDLNILSKKLKDIIIGENNMSNIDFLSHYTSIGNSFNILENKELWVTRYDFLNDKSELIYIIDILEKIIEDFKKDDKKDSFNENEKKWMIMIIGFIKDIMSYYYGKISFDDLISTNYNLFDRAEVWIRELLDEYKNLFKYCFVLSFSKNQDSLPLWGNYSDFNGINLLLANKNLTNTFKSQDQKDTDFLYFINQSYKKDNQELLFSTFYSGEVLYDLKEIKSMLLKDFRKALNYHKKNPKVIKEFFMIRLLLEIILIRRLLVKNQYFSCEEEYRFVFALDENSYQQEVNFRCGNDSYIPYIKIPLALENLKEIVVGPRNNSDLVVKGFEEYLTHKKLDVKVRKSNIPFR